MYKDPPLIHSAVRTLLKKPELAAKVETIAIRDPEPCPEFFNLTTWKKWAKGRYNAALQLADHSLILAGARSQNLLGSLPSPQDIIDKEEAQVTLLVALCPNLIRLYFENPCTVHEKPRFSLDHMIMDIIHPQIHRGMMLQKLETLTAVTARLEGGQGGFRLSSIATFFRLPNLRIIRGVACMEPEDELFKDFDCPAGTSSVREIHLIRSAVCPVGLEQMIRACKKVEFFECDWAGETVAWVEINFSVLRKALLKHKKTLTYLCLNTGEHFDSWPERDNGLVPPLGPSLAEFESLTRLDVPASALIGWDEHNVGNFDPLKDILPPNLEELGINESAPRLQEMLEGLVPVCAEKFPKLRKITVSRRHCGGEAIEDDLIEQFAEAAPDVDISFLDGEEIENRFDVTFHPQS